MSDYEGACEIRDAVLTVAREVETLGAGEHGALLVSATMIWMGMTKDPSQVEDPDRHVGRAVSVAVALHDELIRKITERDLSSR